MDEDRRPLRADDLGAGRDRTGGRLVDRIHRPHRYAKCSQGRNGPGVASSFGMEKRAIVPNPTAGLQACATPASQATERKMKASSGEKAHWSTSSCAASSEQSSR